MTILATFPHRKFIDMNIYRVFLEHHCQIGFAQLMKGKIGSIWQAFTMTLKSIISEANLLK